jgi:hypothetical protein
MEFKPLKLRDRDIDQLVDVHLGSIQDDEQKRRVRILVKLRDTIYSCWREFALEHIDHVPEPTSNDADMLSDFLSAYVGMLWNFKRLRKSQDKVRKYAASIRINIYDKTLRVWKSTSGLYLNRNLDAFEFYDELTKLAVSIGMVARELQLIGNQQMNAPEYLIQREIDQERALAVRHAENRAMKHEVHTWLASNMVSFKSMDAAAQAITKQQPISFRTARDWVGEWRKLRSARTP